MVKHCWVTVVKASLILILKTEGIRRKTLGPAARYHNRLSPQNGKTHSADSLLAKVRRPPGATRLRRASCSLAVWSSRSFRLQSGSLRSCSLSNSCGCAQNPKAPIWCFYSRILCRRVCRIWRLRSRIWCLYESRACCSRPVTQSCVAVEQNMLPVQQNRMLVQQNNGVSEFGACARVQ